MEVTEESRGLLLIRIEVSVDQLDDIFGGVRVEGHLVSQPCKVVADVCDGAVIGGSATGEKEELVEEVEGRR
jgi:hypothetical protein